MKNSKWNKYEAALLIDGYKRVVNGHASIKEVAMRISERIRPSNLQDCETYRNVNGITLQLGAIQFLMADFQIAKQIKVVQLEIQIYFRSKLC